MSSFLKKHNSTVSEIILCVICFCIPFSKIFVPPLIIALVILSIVIFIKNNYKFTTNNRMVLVVPIVFYLLHVISAIMSTNTKVALFDLEVKLSFLILPFCFLINTELSLAKPWLIAKAFVMGCFATSIWCVTQGIYNFSTLHDTKYLFYSDLSYFHHPSYYAMYLISAIFLVGYSMLNEKSSNNYLLKLAGLLWLSLIVVLLGAKISLLILLILAPIGLYYFIFIKFKLQITVLILALLIASSYFIITNSLVLKGRLMEGYNSIVENTATINPNSKSVSSTQMRMLIWKDALQLIKQKPKGYAIGDVDAALYLSYVINDNLMAREKHLNAHNQFLQTTLGLGVVGLIALLIMLITPFFKLNNRFIYTFFTIMVILNFAAESMLNTQSGVVFFVLGYLLIGINFNSKSATLIQV